jgi:urease accessory protein UreE
MLCERILGNLDLEPAPNDGIDWLDLSWFECAQRAFARKSRGGTSIRILLSVGQHLRHGDILVRDASSITVAVNLIPTDVLVARPRSLCEMGQLAVEFGNLHQPVQITADELIVLFDGPTEGVLNRNSVPHLREKRRFVPEPASIASLPRSASSFVLSRLSSEPKIITEPASRISRR